MDMKQAAQSALDVQNACNSSGIIASLNDAKAAIWEESNRLGMGTRWVNRHPVIAMYLYKLGELNGCGISSLSPGYEEMEAACKSIVAGHPQPDYRLMDWTQHVTHINEPGDDPDAWSGGIADNH